MCVLEALNCIFSAMAKLVLCSPSNRLSTLGGSHAQIPGDKVHISFWDADSLCPIFLQVLYITYSLDISLKYA